MQSNKLLRSGAVLIAASAMAVQGRADIINGSFETGNFTGWTLAGFTGQILPLNDTNHTFQNYITNQNAGTAKAPTNAVVTSQTSNFDGFGPPVSPAVNPTDGTHLAFLSNETSAGNNTLTGSSISQSFLVGPGTTSLNFDVQFLSNEDLDSQWDFGGVALLNGTTVLAQFNLDHDPTLGTSAANAHATAAAAGGFFDSTGWLHESFSLTGLSGDTLTVMAYVTNTGDMSVESRLLLDNVTTVPEPSSLLPLSSILLVLAVACYRQLHLRKSDRAL